MQDTNVFNELKMLLRWVVMIDVLSYDLYLSLTIIKHTQGGRRQQKSQVRVPA